MRKHRRKSAMARRKLARAMSVALPAIAVAALGSVALQLGAGATSASGAKQKAVTYTAIIKIPAPPASNFQGASAGGDGWAVALSSTQVFNVFHHKGFLGVECHLQTDASVCPGYPKYVTEAVNGAQARFGTSGQPGLWFDQNNSHLFVFATRAGQADSTTAAPGGVVRIDTTSASSNPFCGFTVLGNAPLVPYPNEQPWISAISDPVTVGTNWYAFDYFFGATPAGAEDKMLCFSLTTLAACPGQPFSVNYGGGTVVNYNSASGLNGLTYSPTQPFGGCGSWPCPVPSPSIGASAGRIIVPVTTGSPVSQNNVLACFDPSNGKGCAGSWPATIGAPSQYPGQAGSPFPLLSATGSQVGVCLPWASIPCYGLDGKTVSTPAALSSDISTTSAWDGPAVTVGSRMFIPNWNNIVYCFDFATGASCPGFTKSFANLGGLYTVNADPQRPSCIWVNSDNGGAQIQNFDAFTGAGCGQGAIRVLASSVVVPQHQCAPANYTGLRVVSPPRADYASGSVSFESSDGLQLQGVPTESLDPNGSVNLTALHLTTKSALPQFLITLNKPTITVTTVTVELTWTAPFSTTCLQPGTTARGATTTSSVVHDRATNGLWTGREARGASAYDTVIIGGRAGLAPTGTVTYRLFRNGACSGSPIRADRVAVGASGAVPASSPTGPLLSGTYSFRAAYSGDTKYLASLGACERFAVIQPGYRLVGGDGGVFSFKQCFRGALPPPSPPGLNIFITNAVGIVPDGNRCGYWVIDGHGEVYAFGAAHFLGSCPLSGSVCHGVSGIVGAAATRDGGGYWLVSSSGVVYPFGDAAALGDLAGRGVGDVVGIASPDSGGYWLIERNGAVSSFGNAHFFGSCPQVGSGCLGVDNIVGVAADGARGYWLAGADGGVFGFGRAPYHGSCPPAGSACQGVNNVVGIASPDPGGYWLAQSNGGVLSFGDARFAGSETGANLTLPIVGIG